MGWYSCSYFFDDGWWEHCLFCTLAKNPKIQRNLQMNDGWMCDVCCVLWDNHCNHKPSNKAIVHNTITSTTNRIGREWIKFRPDTLNDLVLCILCDDQPHHEKYWYSSFSVLFSVRGCWSTTRICVRGWPCHCFYLLVQYTHLGGRTLGGFRHGWTDV